MPAALSLSTTNTVGTGNPASDANAVHTVINALYLANIGTTRTAAFTVTAAMSGEVIPVNVSASVAIILPVLPAGTTLDLVQMGTFGFTLSTSSTTLLVPSGATATPRGQYSTVSLLWLTTSTVLVGGDLT